MVAESIASSYRAAQDISLFLLHVTLSHCFLTASLLFHFVPLFPFLLALTSSRGEDYQILAYFFLRLKCFDEVEVGAALIGFPLLNLGQMITSAVQGVTCSDEHTGSEVASAVQSISLVLWPSTLLFGSAIINLVSSSIRLLLSGI